MTVAKAAVPGRKCRYLRISDATTLAALTMPFLRHGGLFIPTTESYQAGERLFLQLALPDDRQPVALCGTVVWLSPGGSPGHRVQGIGVAFMERDTALRSRIEHCLSDCKGQVKPSLTL